MILRMERNGPTPKLLEAFAQQSGVVSKKIAGVRVMRRWAAGKFVLEKLNCIKYNRRWVLKVYTLTPACTF